MPMKLIWCKCSEKRRLAVFFYLPVIVPIGKLCPRLISKTLKQIMKSKFRTIFSDQTNISFEGLLFPNT
jgi:hypothetical protein